MAIIVVVDHTQQVSPGARIDNGCAERERSVAGRRLLILNTYHRLSRLKIIGAKNCRREQDIDDGAQAQNKHDAAGYAPFGRRCGRLRENLGGG